MITPVKVRVAKTIAITVSSGIIVFIFSPLLVVVSGANRKFGFTHYLYALCCHGNTDMSVKTRSYLTSIDSATYLASSS